MQVGPKSDYAVEANFGSLKHLAVGGAGRTRGEDGYQSSPGTGLKHLAVGGAGRTAAWWSMSWMV